MDVNYVKINNDSKIKLNINKLKNELKSLQTTIGNELELISNEQDKYYPSNNLGIISAQGNIIDVLISKIAELQDIQKLLDNIEE